MTVDIHAHFLPREFLLELQSGKRLLNIQTEERDGRQWFRRTEWSLLDPALYEPELLLKGMNERKIDAAVLSIVPLLLDLPAGSESEALCRLLNEFAAALCRRHPGRLWAMATLPLANVAAAVRELERAAALGLVGAEIGHAVGGVRLDHPDLLPFFRKAAALNMPVFIHPYHPNSIPNLSEYHFANTIGFPVDTTLAIAHLVHGGVMAAVPDLKIVAAHAGGFYPYQKGRFEHAWQMRAEPRTAISSPPSTYESGLFYDSITHDPQVLAFLVQAAGADHVLLGSDTPYDMGPADPLGAVMAAGLSQEVQARVTGANAERLFQLELCRGR